MAAQTRLFTNEGNALSIITVENMSSPPSTSSGNGLVMAYAFGPDQAKFDPGIDLIMTYDPFKLPKDVNERSLYIALWDGYSWQPLSSIVDIENKTVRAEISSFSSYALLYVLPIPASFKLGSLNISSNEAEIGEEISISTTATNDGGSAGKYTLYLKIDDVQIDSQEINLESRVSETIKFSVRPIYAGQYTADINGQTGKYTVKDIEGQLAELTSSPATTIAPSPTVQESNPASPEANKPASSRWWITAVGVIGTIAIGVLIIPLTRKKPNQTK
jgi:hypothetical protein